MWHMKGNRLEEMTLLTKFQLPSSDSLGVRGGMWHLICEIWHLTRDMCHVSCDTQWVMEYWVKTSGPKLLWVGCQGVLKTFSQILTDLINQWSIHKGVCRTAPATSTSLFTRLESLAWSPQGFWQPRFCRNCGFMKPLLWLVNLHYLNGYIKKSKCVHPSSLQAFLHIPFSSRKRIQRIPTIVLHHNKGFINHSFFWKWVVRNPAGNWSQ